MKRLFGEKNVKDKKSKKPTRQEKQIKELIKKYRLEDLEEKDLAGLERIAEDSSITSFFKERVLFSFKEGDRIKLTYLSMLVEQNMIMIKQLSRLNKNIEELKEEKEK